MTKSSESAQNGAAGWAPAGILRQVGDAPEAELGPSRATFPLSGDETGGRYSLTEFTMAPPPAPGPPPHIHEDADEAIYVLEGTLEMGIGEQSLIGSAGQGRRATGSGDGARAATEVPFGDRWTGAAI